MIDLPSDDELADMQASLGHSLIIMRDQMTPVFDAADGIRADLHARGYSSSANEEIATKWLTHVMRILLTPGDPE